jgi:hypothetical protein
MATIDDIINGTFNSLGRDVPFVPATSSVSDMYAGIYAPASPRSRDAYGGAQTSMRDALIARSRLPGGEAQQRFRLPTGEYVEVNAANMPKGKQPLEITVNGGNPALTPSAVANIPMPRMRPSFGPGNQPTSMDLAAIEAQNRPAATVGPTLDDLLAYAQGLPDDPTKGAVAAATGAGAPVTNVTGKMQPTNRGGLFGMLFGGNANAGGGGRGLFGMVNAPRAPRAPNTYTPATSVSGNTGYRNERTGVLHTSDKGRQYGTSATGQRTDYGASPGQKTSGLKPGDRVYNSDTNSWELK